MNINLSSPSASSSSSPSDSGLSSSRPRSLSEAVTPGTAGAPKPSGKDEEVKDAGPGEGGSHNNTPHARRHSQGSVIPDLTTITSTAQDYPDEFFEARDDSVLILRHPYYNEVTEDLGATAETLLEEEDNNNANQDYLDAMEPGFEGLSAAQIEETLPDVERHESARSADMIPLMSVDVQQSHVMEVSSGKEAPLLPPSSPSSSSPLPPSQLSAGQHRSEPSVKEETAMPTEGDPDDTCHINYGLLKRYLETVGSQPSTSNTDTMDRFAFYSAKTGFVRAATLQDTSPYLVSVMQSGVFWLDICAPSPLELKVFGEVFRMHPLTLEDIQLDDVREKCDVFQDYFIVCLKAYEHTPGSRDFSTPVNLYVLCAGRACVVSIHHQPLNFSQTIAKRIRLLSARTGLSTDWITYGIMDDVIDSFSPAIYECECDTEAIDDACMQPGIAKAVPVVAASTGPEPDYSSASMFGRITACRKGLTQLSRLVSAKNEAVRNVLKRCASRLSEDALVYLRDLQDHVHTMEQSLEHCDDALNRAYSNYLAHISIETSHTSNRMSRVMKTLSAFAAVTTPCTVVSCLLGMNLKGPFWPYGADKDGPGSGSGAPYDFVLVVSFILAATVSLVYVGKKYDWF